MRLTRRHFIRAGAALMAAPIVLRAGSGFAAETVTLRMHHFLPPGSNVQKRLLEPWVKAMAEESGGRLVVEIFPAMQLGGKPPQLYDQAANGVVDIVWTLPGSTPGRFPATEAFELPFIAAQRATVNAPAFQEYADAHVVAEAKETKLLCCWAHDQGVIHTNKPIAGMADLAGLKLRNPTRLAGEALTALGATSVGMPISQTPEALAQRTIDGAVLPWEVVPSLKMDELTRYHTELEGTPTLYSTTFFLAMNKPRYEALPQDLRAVLDKHTGMTFARLAGAMWDAVGAEARAAVAAADASAVAVIPQADKAAWIEATAPVRQRWIEAMKERGSDGEALIRAAQEAIAKYTPA